MKDCKFCHTPFTPKNSKGVFCSTKCRVYYNRKYPVSNAKTVIPAALSELFMGIPVPSGLKGIDLTIWKAEVRAKEKLNP